MLNAVYSLNNAPSKQLITDWLKQRQSLLIALYDLCDYRPFYLKLSCKELHGALQEFGGQILDYLSLGHFKIYEKIIDNVEDHLASIVNQLTESTHQILHLNDNHRYCLNTLQLESDLGVLTEKLAKRFELEDKLISNYLYSNPRRKKGKTWIN
jgi:regulator of sigma D